MNNLHIRNRQKVRNIRKAEFSRIAHFLLDDLLDLPGYDLAVHFLNAKTMAKANWDFLQHKGSTDVITFDYREGYNELQANGGGGLKGEIFISIEDALSQSIEFDTLWQQEVIRYFVHGTLHLLGYEDLQPSQRKIMKREENKLVRLVSKKFSLEAISNG
jgi:probable rRNA maturation factor